MDNKEISKEDILNRMKKIEGQAKGIQKMIEEDKCCGDIMVQISAIRSAINKVGGLIMDRYIKECLKESLKDENSDKSIEEIIETIVRYVK
ncbi:MAG TPA: metal-sensitive transcriptional regulator [Bacillota bacterium]|nr:metal-sensitive transcriptional regulator [Clostridiaceae bacterium]HNR04101.1 metal-sensitive transcriptional regulator [Bacillota bacterium]HNT03133.1 metal-sensitive transcriptional regulator [Bacillota bacterium]HPA53973.1 metal-sensitive transcriptional regulator [Bacillota bacterium]HPW40088.1 metal-sensitive transcriptional regulator [Bacillota bacterium]